MHACMYTHSIPTSVLQTLISDLSVEEMQKNSPYLYYSVALIIQICLILLAKIARKIRSTRTKFDTLAALQLLSQPSKMGFHANLGNHDLPLTENLVSESYMYIQMYT